MSYTEPTKETLNILDINVTFEENGPLLRIQVLQKNTASSANPLNGPLLHG